MNELKLQENQQELFSDFVPESHRPERIPSIAKVQKPILISTTIEQILLVGIVSILVCCLVFFLGMLRGRYVSGANFISNNSAVLLKTPDAPKTILAPVAIPAALQKAPVLRITKVSPAAKKESPPVLLKNSKQKPYTIQVLTTKKKGYAEQESVFLKKSGYDSWIALSSDYYVVCVGSYINRDDAKKDLAYFSSKYKGSYLRRK